MKNIVKAVVVLVSCVLISFFSGCASTQSAPTVDNSLPWWCTAAGGYTFKSEEIDAQPKGVTWPKESGYFAEGMAKRADSRQSSIAAKLDSKATLADYIKSEIKREEGDTGELATRLDSSNIDVILSGARVIDSVVASDGTVHILMYMSKKDYEQNKERALKVE